MEKKPQYPQDDLKSAVESVKSGLNSLRKAQKIYNVPRSTLFSKLKGDVVIEKHRPGPKATLSKEEESVISDWAIKCSARGHPRTPNDIRFAAKTILDEFPRKNKLKENLPSYKWYLNFLKRNPVLKSRKPEALSGASANVSENDLRNWWSGINQYMDNNNFLDIINDPTRVANCDESMFEFNPKPTKVIVEKTSKNSYFSQISGNKTGCTVLHTVSRVALFTSKMC